MFPDNAKAQYISARIHRLGIKDVQLFYDHQVKLWAMCQVRKVQKTVLILENTTGTDIKPMIMFWIRTPKGAYRAPNEQDINDVVAIVQKAQITFQKSKNNPNWLDDQMLEAERIKTEKHKKRQDENLRYAIRHFEVQKDIRRSLG